MRKGILARTVPILRHYMAEQDRPLTSREISDLLGLNPSTVYNILAYMEALDIVDHVKMGRKYLYYLKGTYDLDRLAAIMSKPKKRKPRRRERAAQKTKPAPTSKKVHPVQPDGPAPPKDLVPALAVWWTPQPEPRVEEAPPAPQEVERATGIGTPLHIKVGRYGRVELLPDNLRLLTAAETRYLKERYLRGLDGYEEIEGFNTFFAEKDALSSGEYGNVYYICRGEPYSWKRIYRVEVLSRGGIDMSEVKFTLKPIEEEPETKRKVRSKYDPIIDQFLESEYKMVEVNVEGRDLSSVRTILGKRIEVRGLKDRLMVAYRGGVLYLKKL